MALEQDLLSLPPAAWVVGRAVVFDWCDGPRGGVCLMVRPPAEFSFELLDERHNPDGLDDRLFQLKQLPTGSVDAIWNSLADLGPPTTPVWIPVWRFPNEGVRQQAESRVNETLSQAQITPVVIATRDMETFLGCWLIKRDSDANHDWFSTLGISQQQLAEGG